MEEAEANLIALNNEIAAFTDKQQKLRNYLALLNNLEILVKNIKPSQVLGDIFLSRTFVIFVCFGSC